MPNHLTRFGGTFIDLSRVEFVQFSYDGNATKAEVNFRNQDSSLHVLNSDAEMLRKALMEEESQ